MKKMKNAPKKAKVKPEKKRAPKTTVKIKNAKQKAGKKEKRPHEKSEVPFFRSIAVRLIASFLVPVLSVVVLGVASYKTASSAIVNTYKDSVQQTTETIQQYVSLIVSSEKDDFKPYLTEKKLKKYFGGLMDVTELNTTRNDYRTKILNKLAIDSKLEGAYFVADDRMAIDTENYVNDKQIYTNYKNTEQGKPVCDSATEWFTFGQNDEADEALGMTSTDYCIRIAKKMNNQPAVMIIDISASFVRDAMASLDPGENGCVAMITTDGREFYSDETREQTEAVFYGTDFYQKAMEGKETSGNQMVKIDGNEYMFVYSKLTTGDVLIAALIPSAELLEQSAGIKNLTTVMGLICAIVALLLGTLISRQISGTIQYILRQLRKVSKGDLTVHLQGKHKDELGLLCEGVNDTVEHMKSLILDVNDVSQQVGEAAVHVAESSGTFMQTSQNIQDAVLEIESGVNKLDSGSDNCLSQMDSLSGKINNVSSNADELGRLTGKTGETIAVGIASVQSLTETSEATAEITREVIQSIQELEDKSKSISHIVSAINDIAEQTNLLSLNASIEAARAGEAGRGFSVVAEEIRKLADQCLASAGQISAIVDEIVGKTEDVVQIARKAEEAVSSQSGVVEDTTNSFRQIDKLAEQLIQALQIISNNVQEMNGARNETLSAIESISSASTQTAECSSSVHNAAGTQLEAVKNLDEASQSLTAKAESLLDALSTFQV